MGTYTKISKNIQQILVDNPKTPNKKVTWINICNPRKPEIEYLRKKFGFSLSHLQASSSLATAQRPSIEKTDEYTFIILHFPFIVGNSVVSGEIDFFIGKDYIVTLHNDIRALSDFFNLYKKSADSFLAFKNELSMIVLYEILENLMMKSFQIFDENAKKINELEEEIFTQESRKAVSTILTLRRNIIGARRIMQNHRNILHKLVQIEFEAIQDAQIKKLFNNLQETLTLIWNNLESQKEMIEVLNNTNESLLNDKISDIMKTLTIFSVIVFPLTLLAAIFGMNTVNSMPFINSEYGFWLVIGVMCIGCLGMLFFFERKGWLK